MSLILVVDPDSRHATKVATMARKHMKAEFVTADSGFRALEVLADRVPDVVLTAPLLPHRDEVVLSDYLRALGDAGAHVQTLTIPILSGGSLPQRGVRGRFRRDRPAPASDGCDPELFAEQVNQYLKRAEKTRRVTEEPVESAVADDIDLTPFLDTLVEAPPTVRRPEVVCAELVDDTRDLRPFPPVLPLSPLQPFPPSPRNTSSPCPRR